MTSSDSIRAMVHTTHSLPMSLVKANLGWRLVLLKPFETGAMSIQAMTEVVVASCEQISKNLQETIARWQLSFGRSVEGDEPSPSSVKRLFALWCSMWVISITSDRSSESL